MTEAYDLLCAQVTINNEKYILGVLYHLPKSAEDTDGNLYTEINIALSEIEMR